MKKKLLKITMTLSIMAVVMLVGVVAVKADGQWFNTSISISDNSQFSGSERTYSYSKYRLDVKPNYLDAGPRSPGYVQLTIKLIRPLYRLGIQYGTETKYTGTTSFNVNTALNVKKQISLGNCADGKRYFHFSTVGWAGGGYGALRGPAEIYNFQ